MLFYKGHFGAAWPMSIYTGLFCLVTDIIFGKVGNRAIFVLCISSIIAIFILPLVDAHRERMGAMVGILFFF